MTQKELFQKAESVSDYNSNNAWGFGGIAGKEYQFRNGHVVIIAGRAYYRHAPSHPWVNVYVNGVVTMRTRKLNANDVDVILNIINS